MYAFKTEKKATEFGVNIQKCTVPDKQFHMQRGAESYAQFSLFSSVVENNSKPMQPNANKIPFGSIVLGWQQKSQQITGNSARHHQG